MQDTNTMQTGGAPLTDEQRIATDREAIFVALRAAGVQRAVASYCGSGDEGGPDGVRFELPDDGTLEDNLTVLQHRTDHQWIKEAWQASTELEVRSLDDAITDLAMELVEQHNGGWEDNDGASGEVTFDTADGSVVIEHNAYYIDSDRSEVRL